MDCDIITGMADHTPPETLRPLFWSYDFSRIDLDRHRKTIIVQVLNYGTFSQWRWLIETYGRDTVRTILGQIPATEIKPRAVQFSVLYKRSGIPIGKNV